MTACVSMRLMQNNRAVNTATDFFTILVLSLLLYNKTNRKFVRLQHKGHYMISPLILPPPMGQEPRYLRLPDPIVQGQSQLSHSFPENKTSEQKPKIPQLEKPSAKNGIPIRGGVRYSKQNIKQKVKSAASRALFSKVRRNSFESETPPENSPHPPLKNYLPPTPPSFKLESQQLLAPSSFNEADNPEKGQSPAKPSPSDSPDNIFKMDEELYKGISSINIE